MAKTTSNDVIKARVLTPCAYGNANDVVLLDAASAKAAQDDGAIDTNPDAVAYAESIAQAAQTGD